MRYYVKSGEKSLDTGASAVGGEQYRLNLLSKSQTESESIA